MAQSQYNIQLGRQGETEATKHMKKQGYRILKRNYRCAQGEIDIICRKGDVLVFVEVKTRTSKKYGTPQEAITYYKMENIKNTAFCFLEENRIKFQELRFDVIALLKTAEGWQLEHIEAAF